MPKLQNKRRKVSIKDEDEIDFQKKIKELEIEERKEELEKKKLDNCLKTLEIERIEKELNH